MQRIAVLLVCVVALPGGSGTAQQAAGTALWRLAATTLPVPPALATGTAAVFWNPAQIDGSAVPVYTSAVGVTWSRPALGMALGAAVAYHDTRLDDARVTRWTFDVGMSRDIAPGLRIAAATHFFSSLSASDPAQDVYAGVEYRVWQGPLWGDRGVVRARYGLAFGHGFTADHQVGAGIEVGRVV